MSLLNLMAAMGSEDAARQFLKNKACLRRTAPTCPEPACGRSMTEVSLGARRMWRCPRHKGKKISFRDSSFFAQSHLALTKLVGLSYCWSYKMPQIHAVEMLGLNKETVLQ